MSISLFYQCSCIRKFLKTGHDYVRIIHIRLVHYFRSFSLKFSFIKAYINSNTSENENVAKLFIHREVVEDLENQTDQEASDDVSLVLIFYQFLDICLLSYVTHLVNFEESQLDEDLRSCCAPRDLE